MLTKNFKGKQIQMTAAEEVQFEKDRAPTLQYVSQSILSIMADKQNQGIVFQGHPVATDTATVADLAGARQRGRPSRKVVTSGSDRFELNQVEFEALFDAVEDYRQAVMDRGYDLLEEAEAADDVSQVDFFAGWPVNVY